MVDASAGDGSRSKTRPLVLLVDDDDDVRDALASYLEEEGFAVVVARDGFEAVNFVADAETPPALIMLDLMMPVMDGWTFCKLRQGSIQLKSIPVLAMSASPMVGAREPIGVDGTLSKPFDPDRLSWLASQLTR
jgi:CheY-like chemotaxis protein